MKIGILGGGQLARMLILEGHRLGISCHLFCHKPDEPAALVTPHFSLIQQKPPYFSDKELAVLQSCTHLTFENEFFDCQRLEAELASIKKLKLYPALSTLTKIQYRNHQKKLLNQYNIPTSPWLEINSENEAKEALSLYKKMVLKKTFGGYDGNGTFIISSLEDIAQLSRKILIKDLIAEKFIPFKRELAITLVRNFKGQIVSFPLVQSHQKNNRCDWVSGPIQHHRLPAFLQKLKAMVKAINYVGVISFELFETDGKELLINEVAPRVHNSAHYTQEALNLSQFGYHLLSAYSALPRAQLECANFVMLNLIGNQNQKLKKAPGVYEGYLHWYGKSEERQGRKLGHLNLITKKKDPKLLARGLKIRTKMGYN